MGADLIGFICRWDYKEFTDKDVEDYFNAHKIVSGDGKEGLPFLNEFKDTFADISENDPVLSFDAWKELCMDFYNAIMDGQARDLATRDDPDNKGSLLIFAGDMSWGDNLNGWAYTTLEKIVAIEAQDFFGLR